MLANAAAAAEIIQNKMLLRECNNKHFTQEYTLVPLKTDDKKWNQIMEKLQLTSKLNTFIHTFAHIEKTQQKLLVWYNFSLQ